MSATEQESNAVDNHLIKNAESSVQVEKTATPVVDEQAWTGSMKLTAKMDGEISQDVVFKQLCKAFNKSPFFKLCGMKMKVDGGQIKGFIDMRDELIGNMAFRILHGGVAATILDSVGGVVAMGEIYLRGKGELADRIRQVTRLATADMRVDYLSPGRGKYFVASAEVLRMGRKGCTVRMHLHSDEQRLVATAIATYVY